MTDNKPIKIVIVGAGVEGLAVAYGLRDEARLDVQILEKRSEGQCLDAGWPIHLSKAGLDAINSLLTPADQERVLAARQKIVACHDGITISNTSKPLLRIVRPPFESCLVEGRDLMAVLRDGASVQYERKVVSVQEGRVSLEDGEVLDVDLIIGADGMHSAVRRSLYVKDGFKRMCWVTCDFRLGPFALDLLPDREGINLTYGCGWSMTTMPSSNGVYAALTIPDTGADLQAALAVPHLPDIPLIRAVREAAGGRRFPLHTATSTVVGRGRTVLIGDAAHGMNPFCGAGPSMALDDAAKLVQLLKTTSNLDDDLGKYNKQLKDNSNPMIRASKVLIWLAQGRTPLDRVLREAVFRVVGAYQGRHR